MLMRCVYNFFYAPVGDQPHDGDQGIEKLAREREKAREADAEQIKQR
jgi:hypothetical protein